MTIKKICDGCGKGFKWAFCATLNINFCYTKALKEPTEFHFCDECFNKKIYPRISDII